MEDLSLAMEHQPSHPIEQEDSTTDYGSDDEEYDRLLVETLNQIEKETFAISSGTRQHEDQCMDIEMGS